MPTIDALLRTGTPPLMAILRGVTPAEVVAIGAALVAAGIRLIEVPLNSPDPFGSIEALQAEFGDEAAIGGGTVLDVASLDRLAATGANFAVAPNTDPAVIARAIERGLEMFSGFLSPSEAFAAMAAGAGRLKLFPASSANPDYLEALLEVLPAHAGVWAVGGIDAGNLGEWINAGAQGVALGGALYRPGSSPAEVTVKAEHVVGAWDKAKRNRQ
jgi:2-dehydro-3-deoxyphosphogalactonate aldolase